MRFYSYIVIIFAFLVFIPYNSFSCACSGKSSSTIYACTSSDYGNSTCYTAADVYQMTVTSGEFYNSTTGLTWVLKAQNATYDIASQKFDYMPQITTIKEGTYDQFRGYANNVFVAKGGFTTTDSKACVTYGSQDSTYGDFRDSGVGTAGNKANVTVTTKNFGSSTYHKTDANSNLIELVDTSGNRIGSDGDADRIRVVYTLPTSLTLEKTDRITVKMFLTPSSAIRHVYSTSDGSGAYNCTATGIRSPVFKMTVTQTKMD